MSRLDDLKAEARSSVRTYPQGRNAVEALCNYLETLPTQEVTVREVVPAIPLTEDDLEELAEAPPLDDTDAEPDAFDVEPE